MPIQVCLVRFATLLAIGILLAGGRSSPVRGEEKSSVAKKRPNVLFIAIDDLNDWTGFLKGHPGAKTPNLDRLAQRGMTFSRAYCSAPACNPSRASLMCGIRPSTSGVYQNSQPWRPVMKDAVTLTQHFMANGYEAVGCGKIFHGGFDDKASWHDYYHPKGDAQPEKKPLNGIPNTAHFDWGPLDAPDEAMADYKIVDYGIEYLGKSHEKPFFLAVGLHKPHLPWYAPQKYFDAFPLSGIELPKVTDNDLADVPLPGVRMARPDGDHAKVLKHDQWKKAVQGYLATTSFCDAQIGRLLKAFENSPYAENTIVVLWGDHGWHLGEKEHWRKFALWEEATRVPLIISAPGKIAAGSVCERPVTLLDLYPTLAEYCGLPARSELEGASLVPLLKDPKAAWERPALTTHGKDNHALRSERWRYIRYADGTEELYDHQADPQEWTNLASQTEYASIKQELAAWLPKQNAENAPSSGGKKRAAKKQAKKRKS